MSHLTAEQAAQRLLTTKEHLKPQLDQKSSSSISWAFRDSVDTTGALNWISEHLDAHKNGLSDDELELLAYLDRIDYRQDKLPTQAQPAFMLRQEQNKLQTKIGRSERHAGVVREQNGMLKNRVDQMDHELADLRAEEERLIQEAYDSDTELARLTSGYLGQLDEAKWAATSLADILCAPSDAQEGYHYLYQHGQVIRSLDEVMQKQLEALGEQVAGQLEQVDELPTPWKEFEPFAATTVPELLGLAVEESERIRGKAGGLAKDICELEIANELISAIEKEVEAVSKDKPALLQRCLAIDKGQGKGEIKGIDRHIGDQAKHIAASTSLVSANSNNNQSMVPSDLANTLQFIDQSCSELVDAQEAQMNQMLNYAKQRLDPYENAALAIRQGLVSEQQMLAGWHKLWSVVKSSLEQTSSDLERDKKELERLAATKANLQVIHPEDVLGLSIRSLVDVGSRVNESILGPDGSTAALVGADGKSGPLYELLSSFFWLEKDDGGAFSEWKALAKDTRACQRNSEAVQKEVQGEVYESERLERQMQVI